LRDVAVIGKVGSAEAMLGRNTTINANSLFYETFLAGMGITER
jgi:hypothetical protein